MQSEVQVSKPFQWSAVLRARHVALPSEHGAWVFLLSPLVIGLAAGGLRPASLLLAVAALSAFLVRQPVTMAVKVLGGRRPKSELKNIWFWLALYGLVGVAAVAGLIFLQYGFLLWLALPALPIFVWHLWLVRRRAERRQMLVEMAASGVLALAAPAAYWVGRGAVDWTGWLLWGLAWLQVIGTILYAYLRLEQRQLKEIPGASQSRAMARPAFWYNAIALFLVVGLAIGRVVPMLLPLAYLIQPLEVIWGTLRPATGMKPKIIGIRQLVVSSLFTVAFIVFWSLS